MEGMKEVNLEWKIGHLTQLLEGRKEEYAIFGKTSEDAERDSEIRWEIEQMKKQLNPN